LVTILLKKSGPGLPDFSWHNKSKWGKIYQITTILPNGHEIYQMTLNIPNDHKIYQHFLF
jgi:hypothetical protein